MKNSKRKSNFIKVCVVASALTLSLRYDTVYAQLSTIPSGQHLYVSIDDYGDAAGEYLKSKSDQIGSVTVIYGQYIYPHDPLKVNEQVLKAAIIKAFPDSNSKGIAALDWEGKAFDILAHSDVTDQDYQDVLAQYQKALQIAKATRPNISWGFFGIPFRRIVYRSDDDWKKNNDKIGPLLKAVDVFMPSLYASYAFGPDFAEKGSLSTGQSIFSKDTKQNLYLAAKFKKPVLVFIWDRYEISDTAYREKVIPINQFNQITSAILNTSYSGKKVNGIVFWAKDTYFYTHKNKVYLNEATDLDSFKRHYDSLIINYSDNILKQINHTR